MEARWQPRLNPIFRNSSKKHFLHVIRHRVFCDYSNVNFSQTARRISIKIKDFKVRLLHYRPALTVTPGKINLSRYSAPKSNETNLNGLSRGVFSITDRRSGQVGTLLNDSDKFAETFTEYTLDLYLEARWQPRVNPIFRNSSKKHFLHVIRHRVFCDYSNVNFSQTARRISIKIKDFKVRLLHYRPALTVTPGKINLSRYSAPK